VRPPADALAVAANVTVIAPTHDGDLRFGPNGFAAATSTANFQAGQVRGNNAVIALTGDPLGASPYRPTSSPAATDLALDVVGYFK